MPRAGSVLSKLASERATTSLMSKLLNPVARRALPAVVVLPPSAASISGGRGRREGMAGLAVLRAARARARHGTPRTTTIIVAVGVDEACKRNAI